MGVDFALFMTRLNHTFWRGEASDMGRVFRLPQKNFKSLVKELLSNPIILNLTREQYEKQDKKKRQKTKRVPYLVPSTYEGKESERKLEYAQSISLLCIDIDDSDAARPYYYASETLLDQLAPYNFALYKTASSSPEAPRVRILVEAQIPVENYRECIEDICERIGLLHINKESYTANLPMFLPTIFKGEAGDEDAYPLILSYTDGDIYTLADLESSKLLGGQQGRDSLSTNVEGSSNVEEGSFAASSLDDLDYLRPIMEDITLSDAKKALQYVSPDITYPEWLEIAAGLKHQFPYDSDEAYELFDQWSSEGDKYIDSDDTAAKWKSLKHTPRGRVPVTIRSIFYKAAEGGWNAAPVQKKSFTSCLKWILNPTADEGLDILNQGIAKIAAVLMLSQSQEEILFKALIKTCSKFRFPVSIPALRKDVKRLRSAAKTEKTKSLPVPTWVKELCYVATTNSFYRTTTKENFSPEAIDRTYGEKLLPSEEDLRQKGDEGISAKSSPVVRPQDYILNYVKVPKVYDNIYDPTQPNDIYIHKEGRSYVNTYTRSYPEPDRPNAGYCGDLLKGHLANLIAEPEYANTVLNFLAYNVQNPGYKIRWAILLQGTPGCGKTFLSDAMGVVLGASNVTCVDKEALDSGWNDWAYGSQLVGIEEVRIAGHNRHDIMNRIKPLITNNSIAINERFRSTRTVENHTNYLLFTNHHDALAIDENDRRYFVIKSPMQTRQQVFDLGPDYFDDLYDMLENCPGGLRAFLEDYEINKDFNPHKVPGPTKYSKQLVEDTRSEVHTVIRDIIEQYPNGYVNNEIVCYGKLLDMIETSDYNGGFKHPQIAAVLREEGYTSKGRLNIDGDRHRVWAKMDGELKDFPLKEIVEIKEAERTML